MLKSISNPISANSVIDLPVDFKCITAPDCPTLVNGVQAIIDHICAEQPEWGEFDFGCVTPGATQEEVIQNMLDAITCGDAPVPDNDASLMEVNGLAACSSDNWDCSQPDACFDLTDACSPAQPTVQSVLQALIDRNVAYGNVIKSLCGQIAQLQTDLAAIQMQVTTLQTSCCP
jgi:hypothetical protein